jgi:CRISPR-associated protein Csm4
MRLYEITLRPLSALGTPLMGDTLFGQFCWQDAYDPGLVTGGLETQLTLYEERPFAIFSSACPKFTVNGTVHYALKRPDLPLDWLSPPPAGSRMARLEHRKKVKKKAWLLVDADLRLNFTRLTEDAELSELLLQQASSEVQRLCRRTGVLKVVEKFPQPHNTINRQTLTTGEAPFAPYSQEIQFFLPESELAVFVLLDEAATDIHRLCLGLSRIGQTGFGRDASIGLGRFTLTGHREMSLPPTEDANACYTLAPCVPQPDSFTDAYFVPFVRFGKHGDRLATSAHPFKAPVVMAAAGAVFVPSDPGAVSRPYFGRAVSGVSKAEPRTVVQGYAPCLPFYLEVRHEHTH